jgi:ABC-2 type transport system permease protein
MTSFRTVLHIAAWEFNRWFKLKDQVTTLVISLLVGFGLWWGKGYLERAAKPDADIVVLNHEVLPVEIPQESGIRVRTAPAGQETSLRDSVGRGTIDGLLIVRSVDAAELVVFKEPRWMDDLAGYYSSARSQERMRSIGITGEQLAETLAPFDITISYHTAGSMPTGMGEKIAAGAIIVLMLIGIFLSSAYQFVAITGEKQLRITEQIISAVSPQQWVDGKILGLALYSLVSSMTFVVAWVFFIIVTSVAGSAFAVPATISRPDIVAVVVLLGIGGYLFWNTFFAAIAATINDPNTSTKSPLMFVPIIPSIGVALLALKNPDSLLLKVLSLLPVTSPAVLSARLVLTDVAFWEVVSALFLLAGGIWLMRRAAGKVFRIGVLMYGKEPTMKEIVRWARE